ncbi:MAG: alternative ribosome rescue aminoacyl-tRNA hydrolase ArfB [bacterium]
MIQVTDTIAIDEQELQFEFVRSSGPGGQNVNKVATAVQLRFDLANTQVLPQEMRARLCKLAGNRLTKDDVLVITARRFRTQERNRRDAVERLTALLRRAAEKPKVRLPTRPSQGAKEGRLTEKRKQSEKKQNRRAVSGADE